MSVADQIVAAQTKQGRTNYGLIVRVGKFVLNEWALSESVAKAAHEKLVTTGDKPIVMASEAELPDGTVTTSYMVIARRETNELAAAIAAS